MTSSLPRFHLAMPVDDLAAAAEFYGSVIGCERGRSSDTWIDWNLRGHQFVTHLAPTRPAPIHNPVDGHDVPVPHFGLILTIPDFHALADRFRAAGTRFEGQPGEQWTMFLHDPATNALEFKAFANDADVFAT
jgi:extradiol dioxygenase family protein